MGILDAPGLSPAAARAKYNSRPLNVAALSDSLLGYGEGIPTYVEIMSKQRLRFTSPDGSGRNVFYYPGMDTAYILTQVGNVTGLATKPDACIVQGGTNDVIAAVSTATTLANLTATYAALERAGIRVIMSTIPPLGGSFANSGKRQPGRLLNLALRRLAQKTGRAIVDPYTVLVDSVSASYQTAYDSGDNTHPSPAGIKAWAQQIIDQTAGLGAVDLTLLERVNDANSWQTGVRLATGNGSWGGSATAGLAADLGATTAQTGYTPTLVADGTLTSVNWQRFTVSGATVTQAVYGPSTAVTAGQLIQASVRLRTGQDLTGSNRLVAYMRTYTGGGVDVTNYPLTGPIGISRTITDGIMHVMFTVPATAVNCQLILNIPPVNGTYDFAQPSLYNLTALGAA